MKIKLISIITAWIAIMLIYNLTNQTDYIEYTNLSESYDTILQMNNDADIIEQEFEIPYSLFYGLGFYINTYHNHLTYEMLIMDKSTGKQIASKQFNVTEVQNNKGYRILFHSPIHVDPSHKFSVIVKSEANSENKIDFFVNTMNRNIDSNLYYNGSLYNGGTLCMNIYGGESQGFWQIFRILCQIYIIVFIIYINYLYQQKKNIKSNPFVQAGILGIITFMMMYPFSKADYFFDESDYIMGGVQIYHGRNLYTDFYNQHMPVLYFITFFFKVLKACSEMQFRIYFYGLLSILYMGLYIRHRKNFGKIMFFLPIFLISFQELIPYDQSIRVLADNIQAICMVALTLEFFAYLKDEKIDWKRSVIVSLCIFGGIGSIFICAYQIFAIIMGVLIKEISFWRKSSEPITTKRFINRYRKLLIACVIPFLLFFIYLWMTKSIRNFYHQAFQFNREIYSNYKIYTTYSDFGKSIWKPFWYGMSNFIFILPNAVSKILENNDTILAFIEIITILLFFIIIVKDIKRKKFLEPIISILLVSLGFVRVNYDFHTIPAWATIITIILIGFQSNKKWKKNPIFLILAEILIILILFAYANNYKAKLLETPQIITATEQKVISETQEGEEILVDFYSITTPLYLTYKNRIILNKCWFVLPWYMDWYEEDIIKDLKEHEPKIVVYDETIEDEGRVWGVFGKKDFAPYFQQYLRKNYRKLKYDSKVWYLIEQ